MRLAVVAAAAVFIYLEAGVKADAAPIDGIHNIQHVVMIMQENRSFDSYFGTYPGANGIPGGVCVPDPVHGNCVAPFHDPNDKNFGGPHGTESAVTDINGGKMDGFIRSAENGLRCGGTEPNCSPCNVQEARACIDVLGYHDAREIPNYWTYAHNFALQDNMFESAASWSQPEHLFNVSSWSASCPGGDPNPMDCENSLAPPPIDKAPRAWTDITYLLAKAHVSWRYYIFEGSEPDCESDEAITCKPVKQGPTTPSIWNQLPDFTTVKQDGQLGNIQSLTNFYSAVHESSSCGLPNVSWVVPNKKVSEHPTSAISEGQTYVTTLVNSIMRSPCWNNTAIFLSWDDWGGFYDHVVPPTIDENGYGLRVPGLVISPYAKNGYIDHQQLSHDAYLKFIEDDFLQRARLNPATDGRPDKRPSVREEAPGLGDLANDFNFNQSPRSPLLLSPHPEPGPPSEPPGPKAPTAVTGTASSVGQTSATLNATVNPNEKLVTDCHFEYGSSTSYGSSAPCASPPGSGNAAVEVSAAVASLSANTTYHFRIAATNSRGTGAGADQAFTTLSAPPPEEQGGGGKGGTGGQGAGGQGALQTGQGSSPNLGQGSLPGLGVLASLEHKAAAVPVAELANRTLVASSTGAVNVKVSCLAREISCAGTVTLRTLTAVSAETGHRSQKRKAAILTLATASFAVAEAHVTTIRLRLSTKALKLLARLHTLRAHATVTTHGAAGATYTTQTSVTIRSAKAARGRHH